MNYRSDATIPIYVHPFVRHANYTGRIEDYRPLSDYASKKTKKVAWVVRNCWAVTSGRKSYATELAKYIDVDVYGPCGTSKCPRDEKQGCPGTVKDYKFYLAFENSNCRNYITEKFHRNALA